MDDIISDSTYAQSHFLCARVNHYIRNKNTPHAHPIRPDRSPLVDWAADELQISLTAGDLTKNPHPFGQIPCLVDEDNDATVFESGAILMHLLDVAATEMESSTKRRAAIMSWIVWSNASLDPICFLETPDGKV